MHETIQELLAQLSNFHPAWQLLLIALSISLTEELGALGVFALAREGAIPWWIAATGVFAGAWSAQAFCWLAGRLAGRKALSWRIFRGLQESGRLDAIHHHVVREGWIAVLAMRFLPGTRIPVCLGAGILGMGSLEFLGVLTIATVVWLFACMGIARTILDALREHPYILVGALVAAVPLVLLTRSWFRRRRKRA